ncbi:hypothetical protein [Streptomyces platensis]
MLDPLTKGQQKQLREIGRRINNAIGPDGGGDSRGGGGRGRQAEVGPQKYDESGEAGSP